MGTAILVLRLVLAPVFGAAAAGKALDMRGTRQALVEFGAPAELSRPAAFALPAAELAIALLLVPVATARWGALGALALLLVFEAAIWRTTRMGLAPDCHCFGQLHSEPAGPATLARTGALAVCALIVVVAGPGRSLAGLDAEALALLLTSLAASGLAVACGLLWRENRALRKRRPRGRRPGLAVGVELPDIPVLTDGAAGRLHDLLEPGHPAVLVYVSPGCAPCKALLPEVGRWQRTLSERLTVVTISAGEEAANQALAAQHDVELSGIERADARDVLLVRATPSALLIDGARRIGAPPATGTVAIEGLIRVGLQRATTDESVAAPVLQISRG